MTRKPSDMSLRMWRFSCTFSSAMGKMSRSSPSGTSMPITLATLRTIWVEGGRLSMRPVMTDWMLRGMCVSSLPVPAVSVASTASSSSLVVFTMTRHVLPSSPISVDSTPLSVMSYASSSAKNGLPSDLATACITSALMVSALSMEHTSWMVSSRHSGCSRMRCAMASLLWSICRPGRPLMISHTGCTSMYVSVTSTMEAGSIHCALSSTMTSFFWYTRVCSISLISRRMAARRSRSDRALVVSFSRICRKGSTEFSSGANLTRSDDSSTENISVSKLAWLASGSTPISCCTMLRQQ
mmetsp:Transcript_22711/g.56963  ORF Transcript_22711/g.56963 Transcript_22711/m.56963 type:complete len:297 (-) Transcript_22711:828-1718(-)